MWELELGGEQTLILVTASSTMCFLRRFRRLRPPSSSTSTEPRNWSLKTVGEQSEEWTGPSLDWTPTELDSDCAPAGALPISSSLESHSSSSRLAMLQRL